MKRPLTLNRAYVGAARLVNNAEGESKEFEFNHKRSLWQPLMTNWPAESRSVKSANGRR
jgi:hypothetical protein